MVLVAAKTYRSSLSTSLWGGGQGVRKNPRIDHVFVSFCVAAVWIENIMNLAQNNMWHKRRRNVNKQCHWDPKVQTSTQMWKRRCHMFCTHLPRFIRWIIEDALNQPVTNPSKRNKPCHFVSITPTHQLVWDESHVLKKNCSGERTMGIQFAEWRYGSLAVDATNHQIFRCCPDLVVGWIRVISILRPWFLVRYARSCCFLMFVFQIPCVSCVFPGLVGKPRCHHVFLDKRVDGELIFLEKITHKQPPETPGWVLKLFILMFGLPALGPDPCGCFSLELIKF